MKIVLKKVLAEEIKIKEEIVSSLLGKFLGSTSTKTIVNS